LRRRAASAFFTNSGQVTTLLRLLGAEVQAMGLIVFYRERAGVQPSAKP